MTSMAKPNPSTGIWAAISYELRRRDRSQPIRRQFELRITGSAAWQQYTNAAGLAHLE